MYAAIASPLPHTPTRPLINTLDYQQGGGVGFVLICAQKTLTAPLPKKWFKGEILAEKPV